MSAAAAMAGSMFGFIKSGVTGVPPTGEEV